MLTDEDIKRLIAVFVTKRDLEDLKEEIVDFRRESTGRMADVYGEVKQMREEQSVHSQRHDDTEKQLRLHEKKIQTLEKQALSS